MKPWTTKEIALLRELYPTNTVPAILRMGHFPERNAYQIYQATYRNCIFKKRVIRPARNPQRDWLAICAGHKMQTRYFSRCFL